MPYTPHFSVSQTDETVIVSIRVPHIRISDAEISIDGRDFTFWCKPYLLNLRLPGDLKADADESCNAKYLPDMDDGTIIATIPKLNSGESFEGLDLITTLLRPSSLAEPLPIETTSSQLPSPSLTTPLIEVISSENFDQKEEEETPSTQIGVDILAQDIDALQLDSTRRYGFNQQYTGVFRNLHDEMVDIFDDAFHPEKDLASTRAQSREAVEETDFDSERYLGDEYLGVEEDMLYLAAKHFTPFWKLDGVAPLAIDEEEPGPTPLLNIVEILPTPATAAESTEETPFRTTRPEVFQWTEKEVSQLEKLPNKEYLMDNGECCAAFSDLTTILIGYIYDQRMSCGEGSVESPWTITKLSASLSWLDHFTGPTGTEKAVLSGVRRILCYPYFRSYTLAKMVVADLLDVFRRGRRVLLRCCLQIQAHFQKANDHQGYYLLNKIFITDYLVWLQKVPANTITSFTEGPLKEACELVLSEEKEGKRCLGAEFGALILQLDDRARAYYSGEGSEEPESESDEGS